MKIYFLQLLYQQLQNHVNKSNYLLIYLLVLFLHLQTFYYNNFLILYFQYLLLIYLIKNKIEDNEISDFMIYLMTGGMCMLIYFYSPSIAPDHIWAGRRWLPIITPFIVSIVFYGVQECLRRLNTTVNKRCIHILFFIAVSMFIIKQDNVFMY